MNIGTLVVSLGIDPKGLYAGEAAMTSFGRTADKTINGVNASIKQMSMQLRSFGWLATTVLTVPFVMFGKASTKAFMDYEYALAKIQGLTNATANDVKQWYGEVIALGPKVGKAPQELAESLYFISSSGIEAARAMDVLTVSAKAATAGLGETQKVADIVTSALNAYRGTGLQASYVTDVMVAAVREGKAEASSFATSLGSVIPIAAQLGVSIDQVAGAMASITLTGASAANASTYLRNILMKFIHPSKQTEEQLKKMGSSSKELRTIMAGPAGLMGALERVKEMTDKWGVEAMGRVFPNIRAMLAFLSLMGKNLEYNKGVMDRVKNSTGDLNEAFNIVAKTTKFRMDAAISSFKGSMIELGSVIAKAMLPVLERLVNKFTDMVKSFNNLSDPAKRARLEFAAFLILIGPASLLISTFLSGINMLVSGFMGLYKALKWIRVLMLNNPWVAAATGILTVVLALTKLKNKTIEAATANTIYAKSLVSVNGEMLKLKGLSDVDYSKMSGTELFMAQKKITEDHAKTRDQLVKAYEMAGISEERLSYLMRVVQGKTSKYDPAMSVEAANKELGRVGRWKDYIDMLQIDMLQLQDAYDKVGKAIEDWGNNFGRDQAGIVQGLDEQGEAFNELTDEIEDQEAALERLNRAWLKIDKDIFEKKYPTNIGTKKPAFDLYKPGLANINGPDKWGFPQFKIPKITPQGTGAEQRKIMDDLAFELEYITTKENSLNTILGQNRDLYNSIQAEITAYSNALEGYLAIPMEERGLSWSEGITDVILKLRELQTEFDKVEQKKAVMQVLSDSITNFALTLGGAFVDTQGALIGLMDIVLRTGQQIVGMFLAEAVAASFASGAMKGGLIGLAVAAVAVGAMFAAWEGYKSKMSKAAEMANGGIVPSGYPNDTYPALLSSGEVVTPPGKLPDIGFDGGEVVFVIKGDTLEGVLQKRKRKSASYS